MKIHLVGIGGISMQGLAQYLAKTGHEVTGCDGQMLPDLDGIQMSLGHDPAHLDGVDQVIVSSAVTPVSPAWPEITEAHIKHIPVIKRAQAIGQITRERQSLTVSGMHGKSTTTGMVSEVMMAAERDPLVMIGAKIAAFGGSTFRWGTGPLVLEADEFDRSFHNFFPDVAILTNVEREHLDYYTGDLPEILESFATFVRNIKPGGALIANGDDENILKVLEMTRDAVAQNNVTVIRYGRSEGLEYRIIKSELSEMTNIFEIETPTGRVTLHLHVPGAHNELNSTSVLAMADYIGVERSVSVPALQEFRGVGQRFDQMADNGLVKVIADYGHHPTELKATIDGTRAWYPNRRIVVAFQPHQYARTKLHFDDFVGALSLADHAIVTDIFAVSGREEDRQISAERLAELTQTVSGEAGEYVPVSELRDRIMSEIKPGDVWLLMGAGRDIAKVSQEVAAELNNAH